MLCQRPNPGSRTHSGNWSNTEAAQGIFQTVKADFTPHAQFGLKGTPVGASQLPRCHSAQNCSMSSLLLTFSPDYLVDQPLPPSTPTTLQLLMWVCLFQVPVHVKRAPVTCVPLMILSTSQAPLDILGYFANPSVSIFTALLGSRHTH